MRDGQWGPSPWTTAGGGGLAAHLGGRAGAQDWRGCEGGRTERHHRRLPGLSTKILQTGAPTCYYLLHSSPPALGAKV